MKRVFQFLLPFALHGSFNLNKCSKKSSMLGFLIKALFVKEKRLQQQKGMVMTFEYLYLMKAFVKYNILQNEFYFIILGKGPYSLSAVSSVTPPDEPFQKMIQQIKYIIY